jgi:hypothetical protein
VDAPTVAVAIVPFGRCQRVEAIARRTPQGTMLKEWALTAANQWIAGSF